MHCPTDQDLQTYAATGQADTTLAVHLAQCLDCQKRLNFLRTDDEVLDELRDAWHQRLDEDTRSRIADICRSATSKHQQP